MERQLGRDRPSLQIPFNSVAARINIAMHGTHWQHFGLPDKHKLWKGNKDEGHKGSSFFSTMSR